MTIEIDLIKYYQEDHEYEFLINSFNLYSNPIINRQSLLSYLLKELNFIEETDTGKKHKKIHDFKVYHIDNLDEFNFFIVRMTIALELSLKGLALYKKFNIFKKNDRKIKLFKTINITDIKKLRTFEFDFFIKNIERNKKSTEIIEE